MSKDPERWDEKIISTPFATLTKRDVYEYYSDPAVKNRILRAANGGETVVRQSFAPGRDVLRRKDPAGNLIRMTSKKYDELKDIRMSEVHPTFGKKVDFLLADVDPKGKVPWQKTKAIAETIAKTMQTHPDVKKVDVRFSGGRGFYVQGHLGKTMGVDAARNMTKHILDGVARRPDVTFGVPQSGQIRIDTTPLKNRGSVRAPYSLDARTGLVSAPVSLSKLPKAQKSDFTVNKALKEVQKNAEDISIRPTTPEDVKRWQLNPDIDLSEKQYRYRTAVGPEDSLAGFATLDPASRELRNLWVQPEFRRRGIAKRLIHAFDKMPEKLDLRTNNRAAQELYRSLGFERQKPIDDTYEHWTLRRKNEVSKKAADISKKKMLERQKKMNVPTTTLPEASKKVWERSQEAAGKLFKPITVMEPEKVKKASAEIMRPLSYDHLINNLPPEGRKRFELMREAVMLSPERPMGIPQFTGEWKNNIHYIREHPAYIEWKKKVRSAADYQAKLQDIARRAEELGGSMFRESILRSYDAPTGPTTYLGKGHPFMLPKKAEFAPKENLRPLLEGALAAAAQKTASYDDILEGIETPAIRDQMLNALRQYEGFKDKSHGVQHIRETADAARQIHKGSNVDLEQLLSAAILHDLGRDAEMAGGDPHEIGGARMARPYLEPFTPGVRRNIAHAIRQHRGSGIPRTTLAKMVRDADKLPIVTNHGATLRRLAEYRLAQGADPKTIPEDARRYVLNHVTKKENAGMLTPQAQALATAPRPEWEALKQDPKAWKAAIQPYLKQAEYYAPGIPSKTTKPIPKLENQPWMLSIQRHHAHKAGTHYDLRLVDPKTDQAHSFAIPKARLPHRRDRMLLAMQQPTHTADYALNFEGEIPEGAYGAGRVTMPFKEPIDVIRSNADKIHFVRKNGQRYVLFRSGREGPRWGFKRLK